MIDIESLIPHREPIKIITEVIELKENAGSAAAVVNNRWPLFDGRAVHALVLIEAIAQTAALVEGYKRTREGGGGAKGWLVGVKSADFKTDTVMPGTRITVFVESMYAMENYGVVNGVVKSGNEILLQAVLQALRLNDPISSTKKEFM